MSIDRGDSHIEDAKTWNKACRHIALYLLWASERGLAGKDVDHAALRKSPVKYFMDHCDTKLWNEDFNEEGIAVAEAIYTKYLVAVGVRGQELGIDAYDIPKNKATETYFFTVLDELRAAAAKKAKPKSTPKASRAKKSKTAAPKTKPKKKTKAKK
jgi:hypothetical protein